jgi:hypothetical protein
MWQGSFFGGPIFELVRPARWVSESPAHGQVVDAVFRHYDLQVRQEDPQPVGRHDATH